MINFKEFFRFFCDVTFAKNVYLDLSRRDTSLLKGVAILLVVFHNYWHNISGAPLESEFFLRKHSLYEWLYQIIDKPWDFLHPTMSVFGVYGVHIFIFLSGYGLTKKILSLYEGRSASLYNVYCIIYGQIKKLLLLMFCGLGVVLLLRYFQGFPIDSKLFNDFLRFLTFTTNLNSSTVFMFVSVWWFLPLIIQLYLVFPLALKVVTKFPKSSLVGLLLLCILCGYFNNAVISNYKFYLFATPIGQLLLFVLGIYFAKGYSINPFWLFLGVLLFVPALTTKYLFGVSFVIITLLVIFLFNTIKENVTGKCFTVLEWVGLNSMFIYITHGETRWSLLKVVNDSKYSWIQYVGFVGYLGVCLIVSFLCKQIYTLAHKYISRGRTAK